MLVANTGYGTLQWMATADKPWITINPASGTEEGFLSVGVDPTGLAAGDYWGTVTVADPNAIGSPKKITVNLTVEAAGGASPPFGFFDTPIDGTTGITGAIPVTGWALDDVEAVGVKIYRDPDPSDPSGAIGPNGLVYVGDAVFVEGARPDVEMSWNARGRPFSYRAGWGYMMLTNMLPGHGNGVYKIYAFASDLEGNTTLLGTKTITCDNAHGVKPFGTIDTPAQGGGASGAAFANFGWVLTPQPNEVPKDGSTIAVWIDGVSIGRPVYDVYRKDVAENFPGLKNSNGPVGYYYFDTTKYAAGVHTIWWTAEDSGGNADGIGSRYFTIANAGADTLEGNREKALNDPAGRSGDARRGRRRDVLRCATAVEILEVPLSVSPIAFRRGFNLAAPPMVIGPEKDGSYQVDIKEVEIIRLYLDPKEIGEDNPHTRYSGFLIVGEELRPLPIGSTLDPVKGTFSWLPGPGFLGTYDLVFVKETAFGATTRIQVAVTIKPKY